MADFDDAVALLLFDDDSGGSGDDWHPPADWLTVPEPGPWEVYLLLLVKKTLQYGVDFESPIINDQTVGGLIIDWGDGTVENFEGQPWRVQRHQHNYANPGQYLIKITAESNSCFFFDKYIDSYSDYDGVLIAKLGENIEICARNSSGYTSIRSYALNSSLTSYVSIKRPYESFPDSLFYGCQSLKKFKATLPISIIPNDFFQNNRTLRDTGFDFSKILKVGNYAFQSCYTLTKLNMPECTLVGEYSFGNCYGLKKAYLPNCTSIGNHAFEYCYNLTEIYAPNCTSVGDGAFMYCNLEKVTFAENCTFGKNAFAYCYAFYPRPDGSTN